MVLCSFDKIISDLRSDFSNIDEGSLSEKFQLFASKYFLTLSPMKTEGNWILEIYLSLTVSHTQGALA